MSELYHYGVKGMKWGVRRYQNKDGSLTDAGRKRYGQSIGDNLVITGDGYVLKKGTIVQRLSMSSEKTPRDYTYVSFTKHDNRFYNKGFRENLELSAGADGYSVYKHSLVVNRDLKVASSDTSRQIFLDMYADKVQGLVDSMAKASRFADMSYLGDKYQFRGRNDTYKGDFQKAYQDACSYYLNRYSNMTVDQLCDDGYRAFMSALSDNKGVRTEYFSRLKKQGYNAVIDDNDRIGYGTRGYRSNQIAEAPLIILDANQALDKYASVRLKQGYVDERE